MRALGDFIFLCLASASLARAQRPARSPYELVVHRDVALEQQCTSLSFRTTQLHKDLPDDNFSLISEQLSFSRDIRDPEGLRFFAYNPDILWQQASALCGDKNSWKFPVLLDPNVAIHQSYGIPSYSGQAEQQVLSSPKQLLQDSPPLQIEPLILSGPSDNRVDLVFFSDGYTDEQYAKFIEDATRLAKDVSSNQTFNTVKPLLNFWAAFTPSNESGIGVGGKPKEWAPHYYHSAPRFSPRSDGMTRHSTPFGLYRDGTELRGVYYTKPERARAACFSMGVQCDYPILMGNDPLYGGLGGEFTVITPSLANGPLVLRHELGHSIIEVGEEYDGGYAYFGVNAAHNLSSPLHLPWHHWLSEPDQTRVERSVMPLQNYAWTMLNTSAPWSTEFSSSGTYVRHLVRFSLSGIPDEGDLVVELDGNDLGWVPKRGIGLDRWHYDIHGNSNLDGGIHQIKFELKNDALEGTAQLCSVEILEFGDETEFDATSGYYSLFPTYSETNETSYRPTNEDCLMRQVTTPNFCKACLEGLWLSLAKRVSLVDGVETGCAQDLDLSANNEAGWKRTIDVSLIPLAQFRDAQAKSEESYTITWSKHGEILHEFDNRTSIVVEDEVADYDVDVVFTTEEVRVDESGYLKASTRVELGSRCEENGGRDFGSVERI